MHCQVQASIIHIKSSVNDFSTKITNFIHINPLTVEHSTCMCPSAISQAFELALKLTFLQAGNLIHQQLLHKCWQQESCFPGHSHLDYLTAYFSIPLHILGSIISPTWLCSILASLAYCKNLMPEKEESQNYPHLFHI